jgi:Cu(I)/Ag(I) efflux system membrane fusion protein
MLLGNDAAEGQGVEQLADADRVFLLVKSHLRRMREQLGVSLEEPMEMQQMAVSAEFQRELAEVWVRYLPIHQELAADRFEDARKALAAFESAVTTVDAATLSGHAAHVWQTEHEKLEQFAVQLQTANDIEAARTAFKPLSEQIGVLAKTFGFGEVTPIYELHCPMAFRGQGAIWYQDSDLVRNPYYGSSMLTCADRVDRLVHDEPATPAVAPTHEGHEQH